MHGLAKSLNFQKGKSHFYQGTSVEFASTKFFEGFFFFPFILNCLFRVLFCNSCLCIFIAENIVFEDFNTKLCYTGRPNARLHDLYNFTVAVSLITCLLTFHKVNT